MNKNQPSIRSGSLHRRRLVILLLIPSVATLMSVSMFPFFYNIWASLHDYTLIHPDLRKFIGFGNYLSAFSSAAFLTALRVTLYFSGLGVALQLFVGLGIGLLFSRKFPGKTLLRSLLVLPMVTMPVAGAYIWRIMFSPSLGILNYFLNRIGLPGSNWIAGYNTVIPSLVLVDVWQWSPFMILIISSGLMSLPKEPYEAAQIEGASGVQCFTRITIPLLKPILSIAFVFRLIDSLRTFDIIYSLTGGGPGRASETINIHIYLSTFRNLWIGYSSALNILFLVSIIFTITYIVRFTGFEESMLK